MTTVPAALPSSRWSAGDLFALLVLMAVWVVALPLHLRTPLTNDAEVYDLQARIVRDGGVLYRDLLEPNLPGIVAVHLVVRQIGGDSPEALRLYDAAMIAFGAWLAGLFIGEIGGSRTRVLWASVAWSVAAFSYSEWCHCQRDGWMLPLAMAATLLRVRSTAQATSLLIPLAEGLLWGLAVWLKPHVVVPGLLVWGASFLLARSPTRWLAEALACLLGGLLVGGTGIGLMIASGCWEPFLVTMRDWNPGYVAAGKMHWTWPRALGTTFRLLPWMVLTPVAAIIVLRTILKNSVVSDEEAFAAPHRLDAPAIVRTLLGSLWLGWWIQAVGLQHQFDYVFAPAVLLSLLVALAGSEDQPSRGSRWAWIGFAMLVLISSPLTDQGRLAWWSRSWSSPLPAEGQQDLMQLENPRVADLERVADYLRSQHVSGRDVCVYNSDLISLYRHLGLMPPIRYGYLFETLQFFPERHRLILREVAQAPQRLIVTDLMSVGVPRRLVLQAGEKNSDDPPPVYQDLPLDEFPWQHPVVFRAGSYLVHRVLTETAKEEAPAIDSSRSPSISP